MKKKPDTPLFDALDRIQREAHEPLKRVFAGKPITAAEAKREAIDRVSRNTSPEWKAAFRASLERIARNRLRFNLDPVWEDFQATYPEWKTAHPRAAGAVVLRATKDQIIFMVKNLFWNSTRRSCHGRPIQVYQSLIRG